MSKPSRPGFELIGFENASLILSCHGTPFHASMKDVLHVAPRDLVPVDFGIEVRDERIRLGPDTRHLRRRAHLEHLFRAGLENVSKDSLTPISARMTKASLKNFL